MLFLHIIEYDAFGLEESPLFSSLAHWIPDNNRMHMDGQAMVLYHISDEMERL